MREFFERLDRRYLKISCYAGGTALITVFAGLSLWSLGPSLQKVGGMLSAILRPLAIGLIFSYLLYPLVRRLDGGLQRLIRQKRWSRTAAVFSILLLLALLLLLFLALLAGVITKQAERIRPSDIAALLEGMQTDFESLLRRIAEELNKNGLRLPRIGDLVGGFLKNTASIASTLFFGVIFSIYFMVDGDNIGAYWKKVAGKLCSEETLGLLKELGKDADLCFSGYIRGQMVDACLVGVLATIALTAAGIPHGILIGTLTGFGNMIPYLGPMLGYGAVILVNTLYWNPGMLLIGLIVLAVIMFVDGNIINPRLLAGSIHVHPLLVVASLLAGGALGGVLGMLVAVPCGALLKLRFDKWLSI